MKNFLLICSLGICILVTQDVVAQVTNDTEPQYSVEAIVKALESPEGRLSTERVAFLKKDLQKHVALDKVPGKYAMKVNAILKTK